MKKKTIGKINVTHNYLSRALNSITQIDSTELNEKENKKLSKLKEMLVDIILDYSTFKESVLESRGLEYETPY